MTNAHIFQITHAAALMCSAVPLPHGFNMVEFLDHWQTLIGSLIGGLMGVVGALIVATRGTRRDRRLAASSLLPEVMKFRAKNEEIEKLLAVSHLNTRDNKRFVARQLLKKMPEANVMLGPIVTQLYDLNVRLYGHLTLCQMIYPQIRPQLELFRQADNAYKAPVASVGEAVSSGIAMDVYAQTSTLAWDHMAEHALMSEYYLDRFIFRRWPVWITKMRMKFFPNDLDRRSAHLLKTGNVLAENATPSSSLDDNTHI